MYYYHEDDRVFGSWRGFKVEEIIKIAEMYDIHCLENESIDDCISLLDEMVEMGILSQPEAGFYRLRRSSFVDIIGENFEALENDILKNNEEM